MGNGQERVLSMPVREQSRKGVTLIRESDVATWLPLEVAIEAVSEAFAALGRAEVFNMPRHRCGTGGALLNVMGAVAPPWSAMGVKSYPVVRLDVSQSSTSTFVLYDLPDGRLRAIMEADTLGQRRTGAASAVATKALARPDGQVLTVFGAGWQAQAHLEAVAAVMPELREIRVVDVSAARVAAFVTQMRERVAVPVEPSDPESAVREADVIVTATGSREPVFDGSWLRPGTHINATGSNYLDKRELDSLTLDRANRVVVDNLEVARLDCGDLSGNPFDWERANELADLVVGRTPGRTSADEITLFESQGVAIEDLACAVVLMTRLMAGGHQPHW